jgi:transposase
MPYQFYACKVDPCPNVGHCPHVGGAAIASLVVIGNENQLYLRQLHGTIDAEKERNRRLFEENQRLSKELEQVKLELKLERQNKFATNKQKQTDDRPDVEPSAEKPSKKRGAPVGHPGWFRPMPTQYDWDINVPAPRHCPHCCGPVNVLLGSEPTHHFQEDIIEGVYRVVLYRHAACLCEQCDKLVEQPGKDEILLSRIGPFLRSKAIYLRNVIGISYRKVPRAIEEMFGIRFSPAALIGFEVMLAEKAVTMVDDIAKKIRSSEGAVHADETYWTLNGDRAYFWVHGDEKYIHFQFDTTRAGEVSRNVLGPHFTGTLVTDCYSGYAAHTTDKKQKCLAHLARTARDWQKLTKQGSLDFTFFNDVRNFVTRACAFHRERAAARLSEEQLRTEEFWLRECLHCLSQTKVTQKKASTLQGRINRHYTEWLIFVDDVRVPPTNNLAERALRPLVVLRKITFGHRSADGGRRMASLMTIAETARRHGHRASDIYFELFTRPPDAALRRLYADKAAAAK